MKTMTFSRDFTALLLNLEQISVECKACGLHRRGAEDAEGAQGAEGFASVLEY